MTRSIVTICRFGGEHGWGHITRSSALNEYARSIGWKTELCTPSDPNTLTDEQRSAFTKISAWSSLDLERELASRTRLDILFIDEMNLMDSFYAQARSIVDRIPGARLVAMDDRQCRSMEAVHLVINTELGLSSARYRSEKCLLGEKYALVRNGFSKGNRKDWLHGASSIPALVMIGGTDPYGWTERILSSMARFEGAQLAPLVVSGEGINEAAIRDQLSLFEISGYEIGLDSQELANWISSCLFGVIGCGSSIYEFAAMGCPFVGVCVADNQLATSESIQAHWKLPVVLGAPNRDFENEMDEALQSMMALLEKRGRFDFSGIDCLGPRRIVDEIARL